MMLKILQLLFVMLVFVDCSLKNDQPKDIYIDENEKKFRVKVNIKEEDVNSDLNGKIKYVYELGPDGEYTYDVNGKIAKFITKDEHFGRDLLTREFTIFILRDTIALNGLFEGLVNTKSKDAKIQIFEPVKVDTVNDSYEYRFKYPCNEPGIFNFKGKVLLENREIPFQYKFVVI